MYLIRTKQRMFDLLHTLDLRCISIPVRGIYDHEHEVFVECEALDGVANSLANHDNLL